MLDARSGERSGALVQTLREESGAYLVVNASFFDPENRPLGLVIGDRIEQSKLRSLDQGIFLISDGRPLIQHSRDPLPERIDVAVQAFPRLVVEGRVLKLKEKRSRRTALCVPGDGSLIIVVIPQAVSLLDLATSLARPVTEGGLGCWDALNLDGGPSTQLSLQTPPLSLEIPGGWPVPNALAILPPDLSGLTGSARLQNHPERRKHYCPGEHVTEARVERSLPEPLHRLHRRARLEHWQAPNHPPGR